MRKIVWISAVLCGLSWLASQMPLPGDVQSASPRGGQAVWRRTVDGWEKANEWTYPIEKIPPALHPGVFGLMMILFPLSVGLVNIKRSDR